MASMCVIIIGLPNSGKAFVGNTILNKDAFEDDSVETNRFQIDSNEKITVFVTCSKVTTDDIQEIRKITKHAAKIDDCQILFTVDGKNCDETLQFVHNTVENEELNKNGILVFTAGVSGRSNDTIGSLRNMVQQRVAEINSKMSIPKTNQERESLMAHLETLSGRSSIANTFKETKKELSQRKPRENYNLLITIVGGPGTGKSSTGNFLTGTNAFETDLFGDKVTKKISEPYKSENGIIIDTPSKLDGSVCSRIKKIAKDNSDAFHILLLTMKINTRMTAEERKRIDLIRKEFGDTYLHQHLFVIFTHGDEYKLMQRQGRIGDFNTFIQSDKGPGLDIFMLCCGRCELVNNVETCDKRESENRRRLFDRMGTLVIN